MHSNPLDVANPAFLIDAFTLDIIEENSLYKVSVKRNGA